MSTLGDKETKLLQDIGELLSRYEAYGENNPPLGEITISLHPNSNAEELVTFLYGGGAGAVWGLK